jgi:hypothetical protein
MNEVRSTNELVSRRREVMRCELEVSKDWSCYFKKSKRQNKRL